MTFNRSLHDKKHKVPEIYVLPTPNRPSKNWVSSLCVGHYWPWTNETFSPAK